MLLFRVIPEAAASFHSDHNVMPGVYDIKSDASGV